MRGDLIAHARLVLPEGPAPFPVVIQMHGCGGLQPLQFRYAEAARQVGAAAVIVDSLAPRGIGRTEALMSVCTGLRLRGRDRAADLIATVEWLETQPWADCSRLAVAGWSHGAWSAMEALASADPSPALARLKLAVLVYPYAGPLASTARRGWGEHRPKVLACLAGRDRVVGTLAPQRAIDRLVADGLEVEVLHLPEATHAFDDDSTRDPRMRYSAEGEARLRAAYVAALRSTLF